MYTGPIMYSDNACPYLCSLGRRAQAGHR